MILKSQVNSRVEGVGENTPPGWSAVRMKVDMVCLPLSNTLGSAHQEVKDAHTQ